MGFLDPLLDSIRRKSVAPTQRAGAPGTAIYGGFVVSRERSPDLQGTRRFQTYGELLANVSIVAASVRYFLHLVSKASWRAEPKEDSENPSEAERLADLVNDIMGDTATPWRRIVRRTAMYPFYGYSIQEWTAKQREDGVVGMADIEPRPQLTIEQWDRDHESGDILGVVQRAPQDQSLRYIPRAKCVYLVDDTLNDSPEGVGLLRHCVEPARRLARFEQLEGYSYETDLRGVPVGRIPDTLLDQMIAAGTLSQAKKDEMVGPIRRFVEGHIKSPALGLVLDSMTYTTTDGTSRPSSERLWDMELLKSESMGQEEVGLAIQRLNRELARVLGTEGLLLGESGAGSLAMSKDKSAVFAAIVSSTIQQLTEGYEVDFLDPLFQLNGWDRALKPDLRTDQVQMRDLVEITDALEKLARAGAPLMPDDPAINTVRDILGVPRVDLQAAAENAMIMAHIDPETGLPVVDPNKQPAPGEEPTDEDEMPSAGNDEAAASEKPKPKPKPKPPAK